MYSLRSYESANIKKRQTRKFIEVSCENDNIPLNEDWKKRWCLLPEDFAKSYKLIQNFQTRPDDVFIVSFMKCGSTWMQEAVWLLTHNLDFEKARNEHLNNRSKFLELTGLYDIPTLPADAIAQIDAMPCPRVIKTHLPANLLPENVWIINNKMIYVARNPKDVVISAFHYLKAMRTWEGTKDEFIDDFVHNDIIYSPFMGHLIDFWKLRQACNIFFVTYEEMIEDLGAVLQRLCKYLNRPLLHPDEMAKMLDHLSFKNMKANESTNFTNELKKISPVVDPAYNFMRRGKVGCHDDELTPEQIKKINFWSHAMFESHDITEWEIFGKV